MKEERVCAQCRPDFNVYLTILYIPHNPEGFYQGPGRRAKEPGKGPKKVQ